MIKKLNVKSWSHLILVTAALLGATVPSFAREMAAIPPGKELAAKIKNWGVSNDGKSHIHALEAWELERGSRDIIVAVIDTGVDVNHQDLSINIWSGPKAEGRQPARLDAFLGKSNVTDNHGHGTHIAGIIGAVANPSVGIAGVAQRVSILPLKFYSESAPASVNVANSARAIERAVELGARVINYSAGGAEFSEAEFLAIRKAEARGVLFVSAAGNNHENTDIPENRYYPAAYRLSNMISVAAIDPSNNLAGFSNYGRSTVDVAAPGDRIYSTLPNGRYGYLSGTSQATAFVSGIAALLLSQDPTLTPKQLREIIMGSTDPLPQLRDKVLSGGKVNALSALQALKFRKPVRPIIASSTVKQAS